jgi:CheY-like chemotaxis protein
MVPSAAARENGAPSEPEVADDGPLTENLAGDDRDQLQPGDKTMLIIEDDLSFARIVLEMVRERGFKGLVAANGASALALARKYKPAAITLDLQLADMDGRRLLDLLKRDATTRHIPVHIISVADEWQRGMQLGAIAHLQKPVTREALSEALDRLVGFATRSVKNLLVVEDDEAQGQAIVELIGNGDVATVVARTAGEALDFLQNREFDCVVIDLGLPDMAGFELIKRIKQDVDARVPIIVYTGRELTEREDNELAALAETVIVKDVHSPQRLLDETALFLHRVEADLPEPKRRALEELHGTDPVLQGRKVLIVDDDIRNIFALTSALERYQMEVLHAENGRDGIELLRGRPDVEVVLLDVMMPEMDGLETARRIRADERFESLPIIALTAKAMKGDREQCMQAGASDYITKPVDVDQLLSMLRVWLYR